MDAKICPKCGRGIMVGETVEGKPFVLDREAETFQIVKDGDGNITAHKTASMVLHEPLCAVYSPKPIQVHPPKRRMRRKNQFNDAADFA